MQTIRPNEPISTSIDVFAPGLAGTGVWVRILDAQDVVVVPRTRDFIVERDPVDLGYLATIPAPAGGWPVNAPLHAVWDDGTTVEVLELEYSVLLWRPVLSDIGAKLRSRTRERGSGRELGTFTAATRPTASDVDSYIEDAILEVQMDTGAVVAFPDEVAPFARLVATTRAAMEVELSYASESADSDDGAYQALSDQYDKQIGALIRRLAQNNGGERRGARIGTIALRAPDGLNDPSGWR